ncbi:hypothetical protein QBC41DRAFT_349885 [Cercophora samala]|uniref:Uncharacterized protein n=1 Tax=Cercophora samala TaxID=330535 RepID=A0AA39Z5R0_9PEZI|nr:hypothetical protein QBC41DRAFT_349885 [Cercophora samala]
MLPGFLFSLAFASLAAANLIITTNAALIHRNDIHKRHHSTLTLTITNLLPAVTVTANPSDPTITLPAQFTHTAGTPTFTSTTTQDCLSYSFLYPPANHPPSTITLTHTTRPPTVTVHDPNRKITTRTVVTTPTITITKPTNTVIYRHCPKTLVVSYADHEFLTWSWTEYAAGVTRVTGTCLTSSTRSTTIPNVTLPTATKTLEDWEYFSQGGTIATKYSVAVVYEDFVTLRERYTSTICEAGQTVEWTTTVRVSRPVVTTTVVGGCGGGSLGRRAGEEGPVRVERVVYTTVTVVGNEVRTLTGTAVVDVRAATFTRTRMAFSTEGGRTVTVCGRG